MYTWLITVDKLADEYSNESGMIGPMTATMGIDEITSHPDRQHFRMYDDDGVHYYSSYLVGGDGFEPLDDFGTPNAGCTEIHYRNQDGTYSTL